MGEGLRSVVPPKPPIAYHEYKTPDLLRLAEVLALHHRQPEVIGAGEEALRRHLEPDEDAAIRYQMACAYEFVPDGGPLAKQTYEEVLRLHPSYVHSIEIAYRLGELNSSVLLVGTTLDPNRAAECFQYVISKSESLKTKPESVHYVALKAHMALGILHMQRGNLAAARTHFETIYACRTQSAEPLPTEVFKNSQELDSHKAWLRERISGMKTRVPGKLVALCIRPHLGESLVELGHLAGAHDGDPNILEPLRQAVRRLTEADKVADEALEKADSPVSGNETSR
jgi:hypothetical protein